VFDGESANDFERRPFFAFCGLRSPLMYSVNATVVSASAQRSARSFLTVAIRFRFLGLSLFRALKSFSKTSRSSNGANTDSWSIDHSIEIYSGLIAATFAAVGIWLAETDAETGKDCREGSACYGAGAYGRAILHQ
jgi:hypothetical protein